ncbi:FadR family transcriptional regulator [Vallitalea pronyensis]|uniref:FadR family transcriptional regulator n=1 Tax=Vallitalea pronyensis TaxID=1348613 RepID=A0A8J8MIW5_9FIRM|nr:FadR/GntR family transcriptional regulator [Vallitalea pronyensis]QUI22267.1 FadR family transcriptional regulator [Vallitalea pronyensis]
MIIRKNISDQVFDYFVDKIRNGQLKPGDKLPTERDLSQELGVSRVSIREGILSLARMGIMVTKQGDGTYVNSKKPDILSQVMAIYVTMEKESLAMEYMEVRKVMESEAARLASLHATAEDITRIKSIHEKRKAIIKGSKDVYDYALLYEYDRQFHAAIAMATHNSMFVNFLNAIHTTLKIQQKESSSFKDMPRKSNAYHEKVLHAIMGKNPEKAIKWMSAHLDDVTHAIMNKAT